MKQITKDWRKQTTYVSTISIEKHINDKKIAALQAQ